MSSGPGVRPNGPSKPTSPRGTRQPPRQISPRRTRKEAISSSPKAAVSSSDNQPSSDSPRSRSGTNTNENPELASVIVALDALKVRLDKVESKNEVLEAKVSELEADSEATQEMVYALGKKAAEAAVATSQAVGSINKAHRESFPGKDEGMASTDAETRFLALEDAINAVKEISNTAFSIAKKAQQFSENSVKSSAAAEKAATEAQERASKAGQSSEPTGGPRLAEEHSTHFVATLELGTSGASKDKQSMLTTPQKNGFNLSAALGDDREEWEKALDGEGENGLATARASIATQNVSPREVGDDREEWEKVLDGKAKDAHATGKVSVATQKEKSGSTTAPTLSNALADDREEWEKALDGEKDNGLAKTKALTAAQTAGSLDSRPPTKSADTASRLKDQGSSSAEPASGLANALADDREEWEKALDGESANKKTVETPQGLSEMTSHQSGDSEGDGGGLSMRERLALRRGSTRDSAVISELNDKVAALDATEAKIAAATGTVVPPPSSTKQGVDRKGAPVSATSSAKVLELSEEEKAMNGAPEGELFVVEVLPREKLPNFQKQDSANGGPGDEALVHGNDSTPKDLLATAVVPALVGTSGGSAWNLDFDALTALRRVLVHSPRELDTSQVHALLPGVERCARSLRSALAKNALHCIADLFLACSSNAASASTSPPSAAPTPLLDTREDVALVAACLLDATASNSPKALRTAAGEALEEATRAETAPRVLALLAPSLAVRAGHKNKDVAEKAMVYAEKALRGIAFPVTGVASVADVASAKEVVLSDANALLLNLSVGLNGKSANGKKAARGCCGMLQGSFLGGVAGFAAAVDMLAEVDNDGDVGKGDGVSKGAAVLTSLQASELKSAAEQGMNQALEKQGAGDTVKASKSRKFPSIKERMAQKLRNNKAASESLTTKEP